MMRKALFIDRDYLRQITAALASGEDPVKVRSGTFSRKALRDLASQINRFFKKNSEEEFYVHH